ncbi:pyrroloquinoline quinone biosynthesis protein PqqE [Tistrella bauzanensis]|uniref:PqqA peptide cyclase n=1 Tax=Tistrella arctica TaxID=3133430 RepID=A0ABU9YJM0_9PROT
MPAPAGLLAELTHRCPLACPYCSNPLVLEARAAELDTGTWMRVFSEAAALGVLQVHLSGGEPAARSDLEVLVGHCAGLGLYTNLITSGLGLTQARLQALADAGLDHVQLSIQAAEPASADRIAGRPGAHARKRQVAGWVTETGLPLTVNVVIHRANLARVATIVDQAIALGAGRLEVAHAQYHGWAEVNRQALLPTRAEALAAVRQVEALKRDLAGRITIDHVVPDHYARFPKACMGGWGRMVLTVTPAGRVLPCHAAETIPGLEIWSVTDHPLDRIWADAPAFNAFRGTAWMPEPCRSCDRRDVDFGGCRCQALAILGDARATDPACTRSPDHHRMQARAAGTDTPADIETPDSPPAYHYRTAAR